MRVEDGYNHMDMVGIWESEYLPGISWQSEILRVLKDVTQGNRVKPPSFVQFVHLVLSDRMVTPGVFPP